MAKETQIFVFSGKSCFKGYMEQVYTTELPESPLPLVIDSPHSGSVYPPEFLEMSRYPLDQLKLYEDNYIDDLFSSAPKLGAAFLCAQFPRTYIDANRSVDDIDPLVVDGIWPEHKYGAINPTIRSDAGIGLIRRLLFPGGPLHKSALPPEEIVRRIDQYYTPYHNALGDLLAKAHFNFGAVWHINAHSMPARTAYPERGRKFAGGTSRAVDMVIGNHDGKTASPEFTNQLAGFLTSKGYCVSINDPFRGVELIRKFSSPTRNHHSVQLEINKSLYMNEQTGERTENYTTLKNDLEDLIAHTAGYVETQLIPKAAD